MTAAIPPACCAGADHGKPHPQIFSNRSTRAFAFCGPVDTCDGAIAVAYAERLYRLYIITDADLHTYVDTFTSAERLTVTHAQPERIAVTYSDDDRRRFQRRIDQ